MHSLYSQANCWSCPIEPGKKWGGQRTGRLSLGFKGLWGEYPSWESHGTSLHDHIQLAGDLSYADHWGLPPGWGTRVPAGGNVHGCVSAPGKGRGMICRQSTGLSCVAGTCNRTRESDSHSEKEITPQKSREHSSPDSLHFIFSS